MSTEHGKKVMIVGGSRGIGAEIVRKFAQNHYEVVLTYSGSQKAAEELAHETQARVRQVDAANRHELMEAIQAESPLDVLVYNAGVLIGGDPLEIEASQIDNLIDINIRGAYHAAVEAARTMPNGGRIIIIGSVNADRVPFPGISAYAMSKSAIQAMVQGLARDFGDREITVNAVQPGPTNTDMNPADGEQSAMMQGVMAIKRHVEPGDVASLAFYLATPPAKSITGSMHTIDGGFGA